MFVLKQSTLTLVAGAAAVTLALAACNSSEAPTSMLTQSDAQSMGQALTAEVSALNEGATYSGSSGVPLAAAPATSGEVTPASTPAGCTPTKSPASPANSDGDPVPDSVRYDFAGCVISQPTETIAVSGFIDILDPTPTATDHAVKSVYTDFSRSYTELISGKTGTIVDNGSRTVSGSTSVLQRAETAFRTDYTFADGSTATHLKTWSSTFTADVPGTIRPDSLPSGTWNVTGTSTWTKGTSSYSLAVTTNPQLHYNATCSVAPKFDAGTLTAVVTRNAQTATVTIQYTACGQYTVTRS